MKVPWLSEEATMKYQSFARFAIIPHTIHVQARRDLEKKWLPMPYKLLDVELDVIFNYFPTEWREPVTMEEVSMRPPMDPPIDPMHKDDQ